MFKNRLRWKVELSKGFSFPFSELIVFERKKKQKQKQENFTEKWAKLPWIHVQLLLFFRKDKLNLKAQLIYGIWGIKFWKWKGLDNLEDIDNINMWAVLSWCDATQKQQIFKHVLFFNDIWIEELNHGTAFYSLNDKMDLIKNYQKVFFFKKLSEVSPRKGQLGKTVVSSVWLTRWTWGGLISRAREYQEAMSQHCLPWIVTNSPKVIMCSKGKDKRLKSGFFKLLE